MLKGETGATVNRNCVLTSTSFTYYIANVKNDLLLWNIKSRTLEDHPFLSKDINTATKGYLSIHKELHYKARKILAKCVK